MMPIWVIGALVFAAFVALGQLADEQPPEPEPKKPVDKGQDKGPVQYVVKGKRTEKAKDKVLVTGLASRDEANEALERRKKDEAEYAKTGGKPYRFLRVAKVRKTSQAQSVSQEVSP